MKDNIVGHGREQTGSSDEHLTPLVNISKLKIRNGKHVDTIHNCFIKSCFVNIPLTMIRVGDHRMV